MNWRIEEVGKEITFAAGSPFVFFTIVDGGLLSSTFLSTGDYWQELTQEQMDSRVKYSEMKSKMHSENPWKSWARGIKSGVDADGNRLHEPFLGLPKLEVPE